MGLLDELMSGGGDQHQSFRDFVGRYEQGAPHEGISDDEAASRYGQVAGEVDPGTYQDSARDALANMIPQDRGQYAQQVGAAADQQGIDHGWDGQANDPNSLAAMTSNVHQQNPNLLSGLLGGGGAGLGGLLGGTGAGAGSGGGGLGGLLGGGQGGGQAGGNPVMRAALAGIAAMAARRMMGGGSGGPAGPGGGGLGGLLG